MPSKRTSSRVRGVPNVLVLQCNKGRIVLNRLSPDREAGTGPTRMLAWMTRWHTQMSHAGLLPGAVPDPASLLPVAAPFNLRDWFMGVVP